jgi:DNA-binding transcriptional MerR regulator
VDEDDDLCNRWYTKVDAAREAQVSVRTIERWITAGLLTPHADRINAHELFAVEQQQRTKRRRGRPGARLPS